MIYYPNCPPVCYSKCSASYSQCSRASYSQFSRTSTPCSCSGTPSCSRPGSRPTTPCSNSICSHFPLFQHCSNGYFQCSCRSRLFKPERLICSAFSLYPSITQLYQKKSKRKRRRSAQTDKNKNSKNGSQNKKSGIPVRITGKPNKDSNKEKKTGGARRESKKEPEDKNTGGVRNESNKENEEKKTDSPRKEPKKENAEKKISEKELVMKKKVIDKISEKELVIKKKVIDKISEKELVIKKKVIDKPKRTMGKIEEEKLKEDEGVNETTNKFETMIAGKTSAIEPPQKFVSTDNRVKKQSNVNNVEKGVTVKISNTDQKVKEYKTEETNTGKRDETYKSDVTEKATDCISRIPSLSLCHCKNKTDIPTTSVQGFHLPSKNFPIGKNLCRNCLLKKTALSRKKLTYTTKFGVSVARSNSFLRIPEVVQGVQKGGYSNSCRKCLKHKHVIQVPDKNRQDKCGTCGRKKLNSLAQPNDLGKISNQNVQFGAKCKYKNTNIYDGYTNSERSQLKCYPIVEGNSKMKKSDRTKIDFSNTYEGANCQINCPCNCCPRCPSNKIQCKSPEVLKNRMCKVNDMVTVITKNRILSYHLSDFK